MIINIEIKIFSSFLRGLGVFLLMIISLPSMCQNIYANELSYSQEEIRGKVIDSQGQPIPGASVTLKQEGSVKTTTDADGNFVIKASIDDVIVVTYKGFKTVEEKVTNEGRLTITLEEEAKELSEVVVVGYGEQKRASITGSVASIQAKDLMKVKAPNVTNMLAGRLPGLRAVQRSGAPGDDNASVDIRGYGSMLVIVDGIERDFSQLDPNDIASISILKDGSAAIYGFKGANGVLLVTTKRGTESRARIDYNVYYSSQQITRYPQLLNAYEYASLYNEGLYNVDPWRALSAYDNDQLSSFRNAEVGTEWWNEMMRKSAPQISNSLNISGGTEKVKYYTSIGIINQEGLLASKDWNYDRYNFRSNIDVEIVKGLSAEMKVAGRYDQRNRPYAAEELFRSAQMAIPIYPMFANNNSSYWQSVGDRPNPVHVSYVDHGGYENRYRRDFNGSFSLAWELPWLQDFVVKANIAYDYQNVEWKSWKKAVNEYIYDPSSNSYIENVVFKTASLESKMQNYYRPTYQFSFNYNKRFADKHDFSSLVLWEMYNDKQTHLTGFRENALGLLEELDYGNALNQSTGGNTIETAHAGLVGRINYAYDDRYLLELNGRYDGTYKFRRGERWGLFPGVSVGWRISNESFFQDLKGIVNNLKIRASYAKIGDEGNPNDYPGFQYLDGFSYSGGYILGDNGVTSGLMSRGMANLWLTWYQSNTYNLGFEASAFNGKLSMEFDWFRRYRTGLLDTRLGSLPTTLGESMPLENINSDINTGFEVSLGHRSKIGEVNLNLNANFSTTRIQWDHHETSLKTTNQLNNWRNNVNGRYRDLRWGKEAIGVFTSFEDILNSPIQDRNGNKTLLPGDVKYLDVNEDGIIDGLDDVVIGRGSSPLMYFGFNLGLQYKGFDFTAFFQGAAGHDIYLNGDILDTFVQQGLGNGFALMTNRWHREDYTDPYSEWIPGVMPAARIANIDNNKLNSTWTLHKADYLRLKTIEIGYNIDGINKKIKAIDRVRVYVNCNNLFTFTNSNGLMKYVDPESNSSNIRYYPQLKTYNVGLNITF